MPYEPDVGYNTLARVDPALARASRPLRYLDLRPTTPEADEVRDVVEAWEQRILEAPCPLNKMELLEQLHQENPEVGYPIVIAVERMINMRLAVEARQTAVRLAARAEYESKLVASRRPKKPRVCTIPPAKSVQGARRTRCLPGQRPQEASTDGKVVGSTMSFHALTGASAADSVQSKVVMPAAS